MFTKPFQPGKPVRNVISRCSVRVTGRFASRKMAGMVPWESQIERDFLHLAEIDRTVLEIHAQPFEIEFGFAGEMHRYTPDFLLITTEGDEVHEVKPDDELDDGTVARLRKAGRAIETLGYRFCITPESFIRAEPRLSNARRVDRAAKFDLPADAWSTVHAVLQIASVVTVGDLVGGRFGEPVPEPVIHGLIGRGLLHADLSCTLSSQTAVFRAAKGGGIVTCGARK